MNHYELFFAFLIFIITHIGDILTDICWGFCWQSFPFLAASERCRSRTGWLLHTRTLRTGAVQTKYIAHIHFSLQTVSLVHVPVRVFKVSVVLLAFFSWNSHHVHVYVLYICFMKRNAPRNLGLEREDARGPSIEQSLQLPCADLLAFFLLYHSYPWSCWTW